MTDDSKAANGAPDRPVTHGAAPSGAGPASMQDVGGSRSDAFNALIARQTTAALSLDPGNGDDRRAKAEAALAALVSLEPRSELEGMLGAQLVACHNAAMECFRRAAHPAEQPQMRHENLAHAARLSRAYAALVEALDRRRGEGGLKTVVVEHRIVRATSGTSTRAAQRIGAPHMAQRTDTAPQKGNGHALNGHALEGHAASGGAALR